MDRNAVIIVTGAAGFIGSCMTGYLNRKGYHNIIIVDDFSDDSKKHNYDEKKICGRVDKEELFDWLNRYKIRIDFVFHLGALAAVHEPGDTRGRESDIRYAKQLWSYCTGKNIPFVYTSSSGPADMSENEFDTWAQAQPEKPPFWAGLQLSHVYGPNEYHKGPFASLVLHAFNEARATGKIRLTKSADKNAGWSHDFVYVKDVVDICYWMMQKTADAGQMPASGLYNIGSGKASTPDDVAVQIFKSIQREPQIEYVPAAAPDNDAGSFKAADISRLREAGYHKDFYSLEEGIKTYVQHFLNEHRYY